MNKWISVKDKLPRYDGYYLGFCNTNGFKEVRAYEYNATNVVTGGEIIFAKWYIPNNYNEIKNVTHWMELPEPPEESE